MADNQLKILYITNMYPNQSESYSGVFIKREIEELKNLGANVDYLFINGKKNKFSYLNLFNVMKYLKCKYDIINVQHSLLLPHVLFLKKILYLDAPVVFTLHEGELGKNEKEKNFLLFLFHSKFWRKPLFRSVDLIITKNHELLNKIIMNVNWVEIPTAVDTEKFKPIDKKEARNNLNLINEDIILFFPADKNRLEKNYLFLETLLPELEKKLQQNILLITGPQPYEKMVWYYNAADVIILPSFYECSPVVIKEAMACNRPIIASNVGDIKRVIGNTKGCHVIDEWNTEEYLTKISEIINFGETDGRKTIFEKGYEWSKIGKKVYDTLLTTIKQNMN